MPITLHQRQSGFWITFVLILSYLVSANAKRPSRTMLFSRQSLNSGYLPTNTRRHTLLHLTWTATCYYDWNCFSRTMYWRQGNVTRQCVKNNNNLLSSPICWVDGIPETGSVDNGQSEFDTMVFDFQVSLLQLYGSVDNWTPNSNTRVSVTSVSTVRLYIR